MPFQKSTPEELAACASLIAETEREAAALVASGKRVHFIWDVDHVLVSGRSDDAFALLGFDVKKYFTFEERQVTDLLTDGPWAWFARFKFGELQCSQDIVTARSSFLALRVMFWVIHRRMDVRWQLYVGHQSKAESYRIILKSFEKDPDMHIFAVDDAKKHVDAFTAIAAELGMTDRCHGVISPQIRAYDEAEMRREVDNVIGATGDKALSLWSRDRVNGVDMGHRVQVTPNPWKVLHSMFMGALIGGHEEAAVEYNREWLERWSDEVTPGQPKTIKHLYSLLELLSP